MFAVSGVTGVVGREVAQRLVASGAPVRGIVRDIRRAAEVPDVELVEARHDHVDGMRRAMTDVDAVVMVPIVDAVNRRADLQADFVAAAALAGVKHLVYVSFLGADSSSPHTWASDHGETEDLIRDLGLTTTILRTSFRADVLPRIAAGGDIRGPAGDGRIAAVTRADVVDATTAVVLNGDIHRDRLFELTGPEALSMTDVADLVAVAEGRPCLYLDEHPDETRSRMSAAGAPAPLIELMISTCEAIASGTFAQVTDHVERLLGRPPQTADVGVSA